MDWVQDLYYSKHYYIRYFNKLYFIQFYTITSLLLENMMRNFNAPAGGNLIDLVHRYASRNVPGKPGVGDKTSGQEKS